jgi:hypothetical protein
MIRRLPKPSLLDLQQTALAEMGEIMPSQKLSASFLSF